MSGYTPNPVYKSVPSPYIHDEKKPAKKKAVKPVEVVEEVAEEK